MEKRGFKQRGPSLSPLFNVCVVDKGGQSEGEVRTVPFPSPFQGEEGGMEVCGKHAGRVWVYKQDEETNLFRLSRETGYTKPLEAAASVQTDEESIVCVELADRHFAFGKLASVEVAGYLDKVRRKNTGMHWYEVLGDTPCRLYFDIDGARDSGIEFDTDFANKVCTELCNVWPLLSNAGKVAVVLQVASCHRKNKFSLHIVAHITVGKDTAVLFENATACLPFVRHLKQTYAESEFIRAIDTAVYTRNRLFRTIYSAKRSSRLHMFMPCEGSSDKVCDHLILACNAFSASKKRIVLDNADSVHGALALPTPRFGGLNGTSGFGLKVDSLPPHAREVLSLLGAHIAIGTVTSWKPVGIGGVLGFSAVDKVFKCHVFSTPRPHKGNNIRFIFTFGYGYEDTLQQYCHDDHCRYSTWEALNHAQRSGKVCLCSNNLIVDRPASWNGDLQLRVKVPIPQSVQEFCSFFRTPILSDTGFNVF